MISRPIGTARKNRRYWQLSIGITSDLFCYRDGCIVLVVDKAINANLEQWLQHIHNPTPSGYGVYDHRKYAPDSVDDIKIENVSYVPETHEGYDGCCTYSHPRLDVSISWPMNQEDLEEFNKEEAKRKEADRKRREKELAQRQKAAERQRLREEKEALRQLQILAKKVKSSPELAEEFSKILNEDQ